MFVIFFFFALMLLCSIWFLDVIEPSSAMMLLCQYYVALMLLCIALYQEHWQEVWYGCIFQRQ